MDESFGWYLAALAVFLLGYGAVQGSFLAALIVIAVLGFLIFYPFGSN